MKGNSEMLNPDILGDIIISTETALRDAEAGDLSLEDELDYLIIHGVLHLLGYDHELPGEAKKIERERKRDLLCTEEISCRIKQFTVYCSQFFKLCFSTGNCKRVPLSDLPYYYRLPRINEGVSVEAVQFKKFAEINPVS